MKTTLMFLMALGMPGPFFRHPACKSDLADADNLYDLVTQARADLREMRVASGLPAFAPARRPAGPRATRAATPTCRR